MDYEVLSIYLDTINLVLVWLGVKVDKFTFYYPGDVSHARFLMQAIYSIKITLLSSQLDIYSAEELKNIKDVALFVPLFQASWNFKCPLASSAPLLHLHTILQMKRVAKHTPHIW